MKQQLRRDQVAEFFANMLVNIVLAWNTSRMHETVEGLRRSGVRIEDD